LFWVGDLHPVQSGDMLHQDFKVSSFVDEIWSKGECESFAQVLKNSMDGTTNRGTGRGQGSREDFWSDQNWWNPNYPLHPGFPPPPFQPHYGFYPLRLCTWHNMVLSLVVQIQVICNNRSLRIGQGSRLDRVIDHRCTSEAEAGGGETEGGCHTTT
jgi:hypothetical protein